QAEDGIRDFHVTGVQTCALPIYCEGGTDQQIDFEPTGYTFTADSGGDSTTLVDASSTFVTWDIQPGDPIFSNTDDLLGYVVSVEIGRASCRERAYKSDIVYIIIR